ncbi:MAG: aminotransferase class I/II-fold pyridoxal phosphate-dependent enzyme [SAR86 cluster bacterium]|nr:aminotransferase class I/II-fold pyridoxal phosphate-dependent enzyme [SAR86 cluster bacterium]
MKFPSFDLERIQSIYENSVEINLTESGIEPLSLKELMNPKEIEELINLPLGYGYTQGTPLLRQRISNLYEGADENNVLVTSGSSEAIFLSAVLTVSKGDRVVMMTPNYLSFNGVAEALGADVDYVPLIKKEKWEWDLDCLDEAVSNKTKVISICNPNNPTGSILNLEQMLKIVEIADRVGAYLLVDEVYIGAELGTKQTKSFLGLYKKTIVTSGLSKSYAHPGLRIGWIVSEKSIVEEAWAIKDYTTIASSSLSQHIAAKVLEPETISKLRSRTKVLLNKNLETFSKWVLPFSNHLSFLKPEAGGFAFVEYDMDINSTDLVHDLRKNEGVFIVPGDSFGMDRYFRIGLGHESTGFSKGLDLLSKGLTRVFPNNFT